MNGTDKIYHALVNLVLALTGFVSIPFALGLCLGASLGKEYGDSKATGNHWDWLDIVADLIGMTFGILFVIVIKQIIGGI